MWNTDTLWFEVAIVTIVILLGHVLLGHFVERSPRWTKLLKYLATLAVVVSVSIFFGRTAAFAVLGLSLIPVFYVHAVLLPRKGINGWTGEPRSRLYDHMGWSKDIFGREQKP